VWAGLSQHLRFYVSQRLLRFLTGSTSDIAHVCASFGVDFFPDEGLMDHSPHTAIIDPAGKLVVNLEGNEYSAEQLGDLVQTVLDRAPAH